MLMQTQLAQGCLVLIGGGEFSFGETLEADKSWLARAAPGPIGFLPTASGSSDYAQHFAAYLRESFQREVHTIPIYRSRDARRDKNLERIRAAAAVYIGGGVPDRLVEVLENSPALTTLSEKLGAGGVVVAMAAAAQAVGRTARSIARGAAFPGLGWLPRGVVEPNFDPGHDRRLRALMQSGEVTWGLGLPAGSAVMLGPGDNRQASGISFLLQDAEGDLEVLEQED
jgi:cyanophycinase-like exopeptidase